MIHVLLEKLEELFEECRYKKARKKFSAEVASGALPGWCPVKITGAGVIRVNPDDIVKTAQFKRQRDNVKVILSKSK